MIGGSIRRFRHQSSSQSSKSPDVPAGIGRSHLSRTRAAVDSPRRAEYHNKDSGPTGILRRTFLSLPGLFFDSDGFATNACRVNELGPLWKKLKVSKLAISHLEKWASLWFKKSGVRRWLAPRLTWRNRRMWNANGMSWTRQIKSSVVWRRILPSF